VDPVPDPVLLRKSGSAAIRTRTFGSVAKNSDHYTTTEAVPYFVVIIYCYSLFKISNPCKPVSPHRCYLLYGAVRHKAIGGRWKCLLWKPSGSQHPFFLMESFRLYRDSNPGHTARCYTEANEFTCLPNVMLCFAVAETCYRLFSII
jgi:hypothetical protein